MRDDVRVLAAPFTHIADELGDPRACNMVMLGALLEIAKQLPQASIDEALRLLVKNTRWFALDERALARGRELFRNCARRREMKADADENLIVYFGGQYVPLHEARVGILTHALHYGTGVFEGLRAHWDAASEELFLMRPLEHFERWKQNGSILHIEIPASARNWLKLRWN